MSESDTTSTSAPSAPVSPLRLVTRPNCTFCHQVKQYLGQIGVSYIEEVLSEEAARQLSIRPSVGRRMQMLDMMAGRGLPQIYLEGVQLEGFRDLMLAHRSGRLAEAFARAGMEL